MASLSSQLHEFAVKVRSSLNTYPAWLVEAVGSGAGMLLFAVLIKRWWRVLLPFIIGGIVAVWALNELDLISLKKLIIVKRHEDVNTIIEAAQVWLEEHPVVCIAGVIGFFLGWMLV